jgi:hypothetical protein
MFCFEFLPAMQIDFEELFDCASIPETAGRQDENNASDSSRNKIMLAYMVILQLDVFIALHRQQKRKAVLHCYAQYLATRSSS